MGSISLYLAPYFDGVEGSLEPERVVVYCTTDLLVVGILPYLMHLVKWAFRLEAKEGIDLRESKDKLFRLNALVNLESLY